MLPFQIDENQHLEDTRELIRKNIAMLEARVDQVHQETEELNDRITPRDRELNSQMSQQLTIANALLAHTRNLLRKNVTAFPAPYFGRIDYREEKTGSEEVYYIGKNGIQHNDRIVVVDWRAPLAKVYYENELGKSSYEVPEGDPIRIDLVQKRTFDIENGTMNGWYDSDVAANDELLVKYLAKHKDAVLNDIIATIQKEQDLIIRKDPYHNLIVQGVAGSGKTTVALHRISHILYNYAHRYQPEHFLIIGSSDILLTYIASGLPDLDVNGVLQRRMDLFFQEELYEDWKDSFEIIPESSANAYKCHLPFALALDKWLEKAWLRLLRPRPVVDEELGEILSRDQVYDLLNYRRDWSLKRIENLLNQTLEGRVKMLTDVTSDAAVFKKMRALRTKKLKEYGKYYHNLENWNDVRYIYQLFLKDYSETQGIDTSETMTRVSLGQLSVYDLAALVLIRHYFTEDEPAPVFGQIVIDEAQDFGEAIYYYLKKLQKDCYFTIMGDVSQNIHFEMGMNDWQAMTKAIFKEERDEFYRLQKSYRNTIEISRFAGRILQKAITDQDAGTYQIEPVIRHGDPVKTVRVKENQMIAEAEGFFDKAVLNGHRTGALICRNQETAEELREILMVMHPEWFRDAAAEKEEAPGFNLRVLAVRDAKGLEFDAVLLWETDTENYPDDPKNAKLLYVGVTRALHVLELLSSHEMTKLVAEN
ncbi:MAG: ATP-binding domain-containing protein [Firmicutes bacterium]|nr:ATP-binding domain-containing protein [Bacillota bacterium]